MQFNINKTKNKLYLSLIIAVSGVIICLLLFLLDPVKSVQSLLSDSFFKISTRIKPMEKSKTDDVVIVTIDDDSIKNFMEKKQVFYPWPRNFYAIIAQHLINEGAKAVVFDFIFSTPDIDRLDSLGEENDYQFYSVIQETGKVILTYNIDDNYQSDDTLETQEIENATRFKKIRQYKYLIGPYQLFRTDNKNFGFVDIFADSDGIIRGYLPFVKIKDRYYPSLAVAAYLLVKQKKLPENLRIMPDGTFKINWYGDGGVNKTFTYSPVMLIMSDYINKLKGKPKDIPEGTFKDKVVFVGASARGLLDMKNTPFTKKQSYPGVEIHATAYMNLVNHDWVNAIPGIFEVIIYFLLILILIFWGLDTKSPLIFSIVFVSILLTMIIGHFLIFHFFRFISLTIFFIILCFLSFLITQIVNYVTVGHSRSVIKNAFNKYLSPELLKKVADSDLPLTTSGDDITASALFIDIQGFTTFSEKNPVEVVVETLNLYLKKFSDVIINNNGFINKYLGDGLMALFGTPSHFDKHADMAVKSAFECYLINQELAKDYGLNVRIGVNSGKMIVGNLGGGAKLEFTAIGDSVNTASRLEGANKFFATNILVGENTVVLLNEKYDIEYLGKFSLKGKDIPYGIFYFVIAAPEDKMNFKSMLKAYENNDLTGFKRYMDNFITKKSQFGPALFYANYYQSHETYFGKPIKLTEK